jgi:hypothetical protein
MSLLMQSLTTLSAAWSIQIQGILAILLQQWIVNYVKDGTYVPIMGAT